ncbi:MULTISPECIES: YusW family protein [Bacillaceae]|uniref:YusW family protein n=1 Tax=Evansella alkalicola TaxID=745819 RepID=A0ABS6JNA8_9BACI|nr:MULTISPECIES: YusW family protein [Bacillaceae]MBU9720034.1 YusW family protein [Bacillus alkalicola]
MTKRKYIGLCFSFVLLLVSFLTVETNTGYAEEISPENEETPVEEPVEEPVGDKEEEKEPEEPQEPDVTDMSHSIIDFELEVELTDGSEQEWEYSKKRNKIKAEIEHGDDEITGEEAVKAMEDLLVKVKINENMTEEAIIAHLLEVFQVNQQDVKKFEFKMKCENGDKIKIKKKM